MTDKNEHNDELFRELFRQSGLEKAPEGFASRVMDAITAEEQTVNASPWSFSGYLLWGSLIFGFVCLVFAIFLIDFSFMGSIFEGVEIDGSRISQFISVLGSGFVQLFQGFHYSSLSIIIVIAIVALFLADRLFRRRSTIEISIL
ncbi:MAG: hypothetical protein HQ565_00680 [Bacteroidetes bacterium]|nr:hypothetical protein [Bacteroidota bacterium]